MTGAVAAAAGGGAIASLLNAIFGFGLSYDNTVGNVGAGSAVASHRLTVKRDGTWIITQTFTGNSGQFKSGTPLTGNWHSAPAPTVGDDNELLLSTTRTFAAAAVTNQAATYTALTADRYINLSVSAVANLVQDDGTITATVRKVGTGAPVCAENHNWSVSADDT